MPYAEKLPNAYKYNSSALATAIVLQYTGTCWKLVKIAREQMERKIMYARYSQKFLETVDLFAAFENSIQISEFPDLETPEEKAKRKAEWEEREKLRDDPYIDFKKYNDHHEIFLRIGPAHAGFLTAVGENRHGDIQNLKAFKFHCYSRTCTAQIIPCYANISNYYNLIFKTGEEYLKIYGSDGECIEFTNKGGFEIYTSGDTGIIIKFL